MISKKGWLFAFLIFSALFSMSAASASIVITEIMWKHPADADCVYIELHNDGLGAVDLGYWMTQDKTGANWKNFDNLIISAGEYIIITDRTSDYQACYGSWSYQTVDGTLSFSSVDNTLSIRDGSDSVQDTFTYGSSYGADGDGNSLHLLGNGSIAYGSVTQGADSGIPYCGDVNCGAGETCDSCPADCGVCPYCGDGICYANESCSNCSDDCMHIGEVCCNKINYTGDCCSNTDCAEGKICTNNVCTAVSYCGDGTCDANESCSNCSDCGCSSTQCCSVSSINADSKGCVSSGKVTTSGNICCGGTKYTGECCTDAECSSPNVCSASKMCVSPYTATCTAKSCLCDLSLAIFGNSIFNAGSSGNYFLYVKDLNSNYTGTSTVTSWIENSTANAVSPTNITATIGANTSKSYAPIQICGNQTHYIWAKIAGFGCNDSNQANNEASLTITIAGENPDVCELSTSATNEQEEETLPENETEETQQANEVGYIIEVPQRIEVSGTNNDYIEENFIIKVKVNNNKDSEKEFNIWSYVYSGDVCLSCYDGRTEESNKVTIILDAGSSETVELEDMVKVAEAGNYKVKVRVLESGESEIKEFDYDIQVGSSSEIEAEESVEETKEAATTKKIRLLTFILLGMALLGTAIFFIVKNRDKIMLFIEEKKKEFERRKNWKEYLEERRGTGVMQRLSKGFLKSRGENGKE